jgi:hypothetical protein
MTRMRQVLVSISFVVSMMAGVTFAPGAVASGANLSKYVCHGAQITLFDNTNGYEVSNGGVPPTFSTHGKAYCVTYIQTYHWNNGKGSAPGHLSLLRVSGPAGLPKHTHFWPAKTSTGQDNAPNVNFYADVPSSPPTIIDGTYKCEDTVLTTWSTDAQSNGGFCIIYATPAIAP